jgi:hypothetical protein
MTKKPTGLAAAVSKKAVASAPEAIQPAAASGALRTLTLLHCVCPRWSTISYGKWHSVRGDRSTRCAWRG